MAHFLLAPKSISGFLFAVVEKRLKKTLKALDPNSASEQKLGEFLFTVLDVIFFIYAMDVRVSTTYKIGRIAIEACKAVVDQPEETKELVKKKIYDESRRILESEIRGYPHFYVETVNLLAVIRVLGPEYHVDPEIIDKMIDAMDRDKPEENATGVDYFLVTAVLFHIGDVDFYANQKAKLLQKVLKLFKDEDSTSQRADFTCLFMDLLSCPFIDDKFKRKLTCCFKFKERSLSDKERGDILAVVPLYQWFTDWEARDSIEILLDKKRYTAAY